MNHLVVAPIALPLLTGAVQLLLGAARVRVQAVLGLLSTAALLALALQLLARTADGEILAYLLGNWRAPFGIALAADGLSALMLTLTAIVGLASLLASLDGWQHRGAWFHPLLQFQLMGLNGAFLTADLFNLFVFFEVLLIASYGLLLHGGGGERLRRGLHYVAINLAASALFLLAVGLFYGIAGTLSLADLARVVPRLPASEAPLAAAAAWLLLVAFAIKAALLPLGLWLPGAYGAMAAPIAALFAIMTKVGVYAIVRVFTLLQPLEATPSGASLAAVLVPLALATLLLGALGALAARRLQVTVAWLVLASSGTLLASFGLAAPARLGALLFYLAHSTIVAAALFLVAGLIAAARGPLADRLEAGPGFPRGALLATLFAGTAIAMVGTPPLSGFVTKLALLVAAAGSPWRAAFWSVLLAASLLMLIALARAGSSLFWKRLEGPAAPAAPLPAGTAAAALALLGGSLLIALAAGPLQQHLHGTAAQLAAPERYVRSVLALEPVRRPEPTGQALP